MLINEPLDFCLTIRRQCHSMVVVHQQPRGYALHNPFIAFFLSKFQFTLKAEYNSDNLSEFILELSCFSFSFFVYFNIEKCSCYIMGRPTEERIFIHLYTLLHI